MKIIKIILPLFIVVLLLVMVNIPQNNNIIASQDTSSSTNSYVVVYTTYKAPNQYLYVPANSTGVLSFPDWHIQLYGSGSFTMEANNVTVESGYSSNSFNFTYVFNVPGGTYINASITFNGITYYYHNEEISGPVSNKQVCTVEVQSTYNNSPQILSVNPGQSGILMYPHWIITMQTTQNESYDIYLNGAQIFSGYVYGSKTIDFNITGSTATVLVGLGNQVFKYNNELIAHKALNKYYAPPPPSLVYTLAQYQDGIIRAFVASFFSILILLFTIKKFVLEKEKREAIRV